MVTIKCHFTSCIIIYILLLGQALSIGDVGVDRGSLSPGGLVSSFVAQGSSVEEQSVACNTACEINQGTTNTFNKNLTPTNGFSHSLALITYYLRRMYYLSM